jgi:hypothetical protein
MNFWKLIREFLIPAIGGVGMFFLLRYLLMDKTEQEQKQKQLPPAKKQNSRKNKNTAIFFIVLAFFGASAFWTLNNLEEIKQILPSTQQAK